MLWARGWRYGDRDELGMVIRSMRWLSWDMSTTVSTIGARAKTWTCWLFSKSDESVSESFGEIIRVRYLKEVFSRQRFCHEDPKQPWTVTFRHKHAMKSESQSHTHPSRFSERWGTRQVFFIRFSANCLFCGRRERNGSWVLYRWDYHLTESLKKTLFFAQGWRFLYRAKLMNKIGGCDRGCSREKDRCHSNRRSA